MPGQAARPAAEQRPDSPHGHPEEDRPEAGQSYEPPLSTRREALLDDTGSDRRFRQLIFDLAAVEGNLATARAQFAASLGVSARQYSILMTVAHHQDGDGVPVGVVAEHLHVSGAFVTTEAAGLVRRGLLVKAPNPRDGRSVLLRLAPDGENALARLAPHLAEVNDALFAPLDAEAFRRLAGTVAQLVASTERTVARLSAAPRTFLDWEDPDRHHTGVPQPPDR